MSKLIVRSLALGLAALAPLAASGDGAGPVKAPHASEAPAPRAAERGACVASGAVGQVAAVRGDVSAIAPDGRARSLACDDVVDACDRIVTGAGASASLLIDDALVQIGPGSDVALKAQPAPEVAVAGGAVRVVDVRDEAPQRIQLTTPRLAASTGRGDAELTRSGDDVRVCAYDEPLVVMAHDAAQTVAAGRCVAASGAGALATSPAGAPSVALGDAASCPFHVAALPPLLPPVAAAPPGGPGIDPFDPPGRDACDDPGSGCAGDREIFEDPDPGTGCGFPGSPCGGDVE